VRLSFVIKIPLKQKEAKPREKSKSEKPENARRLLK